MKKQSLLVLSSLFFFAAELKAQNLVMEQNPPAIHWFQKNTQHFKVIFPEGFEDEANRAANTLEHLYLPVSRTLGKAPRKIPIILQNQNTVSNAFVTISPRRSEFYTMPPQDYNFLGTNNWIDLLAVHEFRHVVQFDKSITGINRVIYYLFGADGLGAASFMAVPLWFWEGDAVAIETALTESGRGRIPNFDLLFRSNLLEYGAFNYSKQYLRSFKHYIPNHYVTGYYFTTHLRRKYDPLIWSRITERAFSYSILPFTFSLSMRKYTGSGVNRNYRNMVSELDSLWKNQINSLELTDYQPINKRKNKAYTNYEFPQVLSDGKILALKTGIGDIHQFVAIDTTGNEKLIFTPGLVNLSGMLSVTKDKIVWNEFHFDPRWRAKNYSVIKLYDIREKSLKVIGDKTRYSSAALSPDASKVVTIEVTENNENAIVILDAESGGIISKVPNPQNHFFSMPRWSDDGLHITVLKHKENAKAITLIHAETFEEKDLLELQKINVGHPVLHGNHLFFNAPFNGMDNVYVRDISKNKTWQVTTSKYGAYNPTVSSDGKSIYYNNHQKFGRDIVKIPYDSTHWIPLENVENHNIKYYEPLVEQEQNPEVLDNVPENKLSVKRYRKLSGVINPYSWGATIYPDDREFFIGATSQDILSTTAISAGFNYNANERTGYGIGAISYQGIYPIIDLSAKIGNRGTTLEDTRITWQESGIDLGVRLPLLLTRSKYHESLSMSAATSINQVSGYNADFRSYDQQANGTLHNNRYRVSYSRMLKRSQRDLTSKWGQTMFAQYQHTPFRGNYTGSLLAAETNLFFPGLFKHHSLHLKLGGQVEDVGNYTFSSPLFFPRGYAYRSHEAFFQTTVEYKLPLFYPDWNIGPFLNFQRFKTNLFLDYGKGYEANLIEGHPDKTYNSVGVELTTDFNIMRFLPLLEMGVRYVYLPETGNYTFQVLVGQFGL